jgi:hypothetical protein
MRCLKGVSASHALPSLVHTRQLFYYYLAKLRNARMLTLYLQKKKLL